MMPSRFTMDVEVRKTSQETRKVPGTYRFTPARGWVWVQRLAIWTLKKLGCEAYETFYTTTAITVDQSKILESVREQVARMKGRGEQPDFILIGDDYYDIERDMLSQPWSYKSHYEGKAYSDYGKTVFRPLYGVDVRIVPYFKGAVVVPKVK